MPPSSPQPVSTIGTTGTTEINTSHGNAQTLEITVESTLRLLLLWCVVICKCIVIFKMLPVVVVERKAIIIDKVCRMPDTLTNHKVENTSILSPLN